MPHKTPKRVHFEDYPSPGSPSPAFSNTSLPSSSSSSSSSAGPRTPPDYHPSLPHFAPKSKNARLPSPTFSSSSLGSGYAPVPPVHLHSALAAGPSSMPWNLTQPAIHTCSAELLAQPATHPPLPELQIICDFLPWVITVQPIPTAAWAARTPVVTLGDVLHTLHRMLRLSVNDAEFRVLSADVQMRVQAAYQARVARVVDPKQRREEHAKGIKRVDFLMEARTFVGLMIVTHPGSLRGRKLGEVWALNVAMA